MELIKKYLANRRAKKQKEREGRKGFLRENVEALTVAIIFALTVKQFAFEAYKVPTMSMEPTIIGRAEGGDRIIVNKFVYMVRDPRRFEVVVFRYPLNGAVNYVKRCVGMPGEWFFLRGGDIYTAPGDLDHQSTTDIFNAGKLTVQRKPDDLREVLFDQLNCVPPSHRTIRRLFHPNDSRAYWVLDRENSKGRFTRREDDEEVVFKGSGGPVFVKFSRPDLARMSDVTGAPDLPSINNKRYDDWWPVEQPSSFTRMMGSPFRGSSANPPDSHVAEVGDVRLSLEVSPEKSDGKLSLQIADGTHGQTLIVELAVEGSGGASRVTFGETSENLGIQLEVDEWTEVTLSNADDRIILRVDGDEVFRKDYDHMPLEANPPLLGGGKTTRPRTRNEAATLSKLQPQHDLPHDNFVGFGFDGADARFREIDLCRDLYYNYPYEQNWGATDFKIPDEHYLMLGDNSPDSLDGRAFKATILEVDTDDGRKTFMGDAEGVDDDEWIRAKYNSNPFDGDTKFVDQFGNIREINPDKIVSRETVFRHFVPRDHVLGRAYVTFWPLLQIGLIR